MRQLSCSSDRLLVVRCTKELDRSFSLLWLSSSMAVLLDVGEMSFIGAPMFGGMVTADQW